MLPAEGSRSGRVGYRRLRAAPMVSAILWEIVPAILLGRVRRNVSKRTFRTHRTPRSHLAPKKLTLAAELRREHATSRTTEHGRADRRSLSGGRSRRAVGYCKLPRGLPALGATCGFPFGSSTGARHGISGDFRAADHPRSDRAPHRSERRQALASPTRENNCIDREHQSRKAGAGGMAAGVEEV
jgi:hypothetical protein